MYVYMRCICLKRLKIPELVQKKLCLGFIVRFQFVYMSVLFSEAGFWIVRTHIIVVIYKEPKYK